jgi:hypothetical protein
MRNRTQRAPTDLAGQAFDEQQENLAAKEERDRQIADLKWLMKDQRGRRVMQRLMDKAGIYRTSFTGNSETFFREGERNVGLFFVNDLTEHCPEEFLLMLKEHQQ